MDIIEWSRRLPEVEDTSTGYVPNVPLTASNNAPRKIRIVDGLVSMPKYFFRY